MQGRREGRKMRVWGRAAAATELRALSLCSPTAAFISATALIQPQIPGIRQGRGWGSSREGAEGPAGKELGVQQGVSAAAGSGINPAGLDKSLLWMAERRGCRAGDPEMFPTEEAESLWNGRLGMIRA